MSFDAIAPAYSLLERLAFGAALQQARTAHLRDLEEPKQALLAGDGDGRFLDELLRHYPQVAVLSVDQSARMLELARTRAAASRDLSRVRFEQHDLRTCPLGTESFDLIVTHFFLDCFSADTLRQIALKLHRAARPGATWLLADFQVPPGTIARCHTRVWLRAMYRFFGLTTGIEARDLVDPHDILCSLGWTLQKRATSRGGLLRSDLWQLDAD